jgi:hypothetical protein
MGDTRGGCTCRKDGRVEEEEEDPAPEFELEAAGLMMSELKPKQVIKKLQDSGRRLSVQAVSGVCGWRSAWQTRTGGRVYSLASR